MRCINRRGDVFPVQLLVTWVIFILVAILLFSLFWVSAWTLKGKVSSQDVAEENIMVAEGGLALRSWLATRLDAPVATFLPTKESGEPVDSWKGTFADALRAVQANDTCVVALADEGQGYSRASTAGYSAVYNTKVPAGLCRAFFLRTVLYWRVLAPDDAFSLSTGKFTIGLGTEQAGLIGVQTVPGSPPITVRLEVEE